MCLSSRSALHLKRRASKSQRWLQATSLSHMWLVRKNLSIFRISTLNCRWVDRALKLTCWLLPMCIHLQWLLSILRSHALKLTCWLLPACLHLWQLLSILRPHTLKLVHWILFWAATSHLPKNHLRNNQRQAGRGKHPKHPKQLPKPLENQHAISKQL